MFLWILLKQSRNRLIAAVLVATPLLSNLATAAQVDFTSAEMAANVLELMADVIEADSTYETAIEAVLGESLQYIIVKDQQTGVQAIDYLQAHNAGRSGFIPVAAVKPTYGNANNAPDPSKLLLNHITVKKGFEQIARMLLGDVIFTETIHDALELFNKNGKVQRIVTKNGDVISKQGILIGGSQDKLSGILSKKHEIKELERQDVVFQQVLLLNKLVEMAPHPSRLSW